MILVIFLQTLRMMNAVGASGTYPCLMRDPLVNQRLRAVALSRKYGITNQLFVYVNANPDNLLLGIFLR